MSKKLLKTIGTQLASAACRYQQAGWLTRVAHAALTEAESLQAISTELLATGKWETDALAIVHTHILELDHKEKSFCVVIPHPRRFLIPLEDRSDPGKKRLACFVGQRFCQPYMRLFRFNFATVLEPYGIAPQYSDSSYAGQATFSAILSIMDQCQMAVFDNYATEMKPNVYIELGAAYVKTKPLLFFEHRENLHEHLNGFPSDFEGFITLRYSTFEELFFEFMLTLPLFLHRNNLV